MKVTISPTEDNKSESESIAFADLQLHKWYSYNIPDYGNVYIFMLDNSMVFGSRFLRVWESGLEHMFLNPESKHRESWHKLKFKEFRGAITMVSP
jgi:hypothetical protein